MVSFYIDVLGVLYEVNIGTRKELGDNIEAENCGVCLYYKKKIYVVSDGEADTKEEKDRYVLETLRHELAHAILYESGSEEYCNEALVHWISVNIDKMNNLFNKAWSNKCEIENATSKVNS